MSGRFLLDTNVVIALFAQETHVLQQLDEAAEVFVPAIVLGELHYGARKSTRVDENGPNRGRCTVASVPVGVVRA